MKIIKTYGWSRRDFSYDAQCEDESCKNIDKNNSGYDDSNYYNNVVPRQKCSKCGKSSNDLGTQTQEIASRHDPGLVM